MNRFLNIFERIYSFKSRNVLCLLLTACCTLVTAQNFPVQVIPQTLPPAPIYISNYADASTVTSPLRVQIILNDFEIANREIRLKTYFTGSGLSFQSNDIVVGASPLFLEGGIPLVLTNVDLAPYFEFNNITGINANQYGSAIPEGAYQFCVEVYDVLTGSRLSNRSCAVSVVFQNEPPFLVLPRNKENVDEVNPQYIVFQWTPRSINVSNVEYELSLVEIWDNQVDPQQAFLSSPPVFQTTTSATTYVYGPSDPLLLSGKNYAWRVQAKAKQGTEEIGLFKNEGYSEIYSFSYAGSCELPLAINHEVKGSTNANIFWDDFSTEIPEFTVRYRKTSSGGDNEWFESKTTTNLLTLWDLKAGTTYEYQVRKKCTVTESDWSFSKQFTTFIADDEASVYECGIQPDFNISNQDPLQTIGDKFTAGDFPIKVLEASGSNGRFTGKGYVTIPYLSSIRVGVEFTNVLINTDNQLMEGSVITIYDPSLSNILDIDEAIDTFDDVTDAVGEVFEGGNDLDEMQVNFPIPKDKVNDIIKIVDGNVVITNPENGESISEPLGDDKVVVDGTGQVYHIDTGGNITEGGQIDPGGAVNPGNVDGVSNNGQIEKLTAEGIIVTFNTPSTYGFDQMPSTANEELKKAYTITEDAKGNPYVLAHHSVKKGGETLITATITLENNTYTANDVIFKTKQGEVIPRSGAGNSITLTVKGTYTFENETIYAVVPSKEDNTKQLTAGAFTLWHLTDRTVDVVLVSVNGASLGNIESTVQNIYQKGVASINFGQTLNLQFPKENLGANGLDVGESAWLAAYNDEQKQLVSAVQNLSGYKEDTYYILVFGNDIKPSRSIAGFMPLQRQMGFVFTGSADEEDKGGDKGKVLAHELGHGVFALQHPFGEYDMPQRSTDWLMDYNGGTSLPHVHWAQIHDSALKFYVFQDEGEGEASGAKAIEEHLVEVLNLYWCAKDNNRSSFTHYGFKKYVSDWWRTEDLFNLVTSIKIIGNLGVYDYKTDYELGTETTTQTVSNPEFGSNQEIEVTTIFIDFPRQNSSEKIRLTFSSEEDKLRFKNEVLDSPDESKSYHYKTLNNRIPQLIASNDFDELRTVLGQSPPDCGGFDLLSVKNKIAIVNNILSDVITNPDEEALVLKLLNEEDNKLSLIDELVNINWRKLFANIDEEREDSFEAILLNLAEIYKNNRGLNIVGHVEDENFGRFNFNQFYLFKQENGKVSLTRVTAYPAESNIPADWTEILQPVHPFDLITYSQKNSELDLENTVAYPAILILKKIVENENQRSVDQAWLVVDVASLFFGVGEINLALKSTTALAKIGRVALGATDLLATATDLYCTENPDPELCEAWKQWGAYVQIGIVGASALDQFKTLINKSDELVARLADDVASTGTSFTRLTSILQKSEFTTIFNKLKNLPTTPNRSLRYASKDAFRDEFIRLHGLNNNGVKSIDNVLDDFDNLISNHTNIADIEKYVDELLQSKNKFKGGAYGLELLNDLPPSLQNKSLTKFEASIDDLEDAISGCRFDLQFSDDVKLVYVETKNYAKSTSFTSSFYNQFKAYIGSPNVTSINDIKYFFRANADITKAERVSLFKNMLKSDARAKEIFEANDSLFKNIKMENGIDNIEDWEDFQSLMTSTSISENHEIFNFIEVY